MNTEEHCRDCLALMETLVGYRNQPIHAELAKTRHKRSMLHLDVLLLIYHFAKICSGHILEIGAFLGGATIAAARGIRDSGRKKALITIEPGGSVKHETLGTKNILRDLERNLAKDHISALVTLIKGYSFSPESISKVEQTLAGEKIGLLIIDADGNVERDITSYEGFIGEDCWMVIDDYFAAGSNAKADITRPQVDAMVAAARLIPLGLYGWSTWIGRWSAQR